MKTTMEAAMPKKQVIEFTETDSPITEPVTKFGGQPVWIDEPAWPLKAGDDTLVHHE